MKSIAKSRILSSILLLGASVTLAGPITTVAWNGYTGAFSFTYDDARNTQIPNLIPAVDALGFKVTFFITNMYSFPSQKSEWIKAAKNGHELANHTSDHNSPSGSNVSSMASTLRALDPSVDAVTFAYPNCTVTGTSNVNAEAFMGRGCAQATYQWGTQPSDWMNIQGLIINSGAPTPGVNLINSAKSGNSWGLTIVHDVGPNPDQYSLTVADNQKMLDAAKSANVWVAPYGTVGAYYRAHFTMDAVTVSGSSPWNITWTSPHPKMPKVVKLKVKLASATFGSSFTVSQDNVAIPANSDGSYTIDFMKLKMTVTSGTTGIDNRTIYGNARAAATGTSLVFNDLTPGDYTVSFRTVSGALLERASFKSSSAEEQVALPSSARGRRILAVLEAPGMDSRTIPVLVP